MGAMPCLKKRQSTIWGSRETTGAFYTSLDVSASFRVRVTGSKSEACLIRSHCFDLIWVVKKDKKGKRYYIIKVSEHFVTKWPGIINPAWIYLHSGVCFSPTREDAFHSFMLKFLQDSFPQPAYHVPSGQCPGDLANAAVLWCFCYTVTSPCKCISMHHLQ